MGEFSERSELAAVVVGTLVQDFAQGFLYHSGLVEHFFDFFNEIAIAEEQVDILTGYAYGCS